MGIVILLRSFNKGWELLYLREVLTKGGNCYTFEKLKQRVGIVILARSFNKGWELLYLREVETKGGNYV